MFRSPENRPQFGPDEVSAADALIALALAEDLGDGGDVTSHALLPETVTGRVAIVAREDSVLSGIPVGQRVLQRIDPSCHWESRCADSDTAHAGTIVAKLSGPVRALLTAERTILNFLTHLSGVATLTRRYVEAVAGTSAEILDTRKTLPGWRRLHKYAVRCGGGTNHRVGLWDAVLIKDNHLAAARAHQQRTLADVVRNTRAKSPSGMTIEIEVDSLEQLADALKGSPDIVLLDNMDSASLRQAVEIRGRIAPGVLLEASGGVDLLSVTEIAQSGVDRISVGRLTHSAPALDMAFDWR